MEGMRVTFHVETQEDGRKRAVDVRDRHGTKFRLKFRGIGSDGYSAIFWGI